MEESETMRTIGVYLVFLLNTGFSKTDGFRPLYQVGEEMSIVQTAPQKEHVIARRAKPDAPQGGLSCPFGAIHLLAISGIFRALELVRSSVRGIATGLRPSQ